jgi:uncharacterized membrane protein
MNWTSLYEFYQTRRGAINGAGIGLLVAVLVMLIGPIRVIFLAFCIGVGYYIGKRLSEDKDYIKNLLDRILPPGTYR